MQQIILCFSPPGAHHQPAAAGFRPSLVLVGELAAPTHLGKNALLLEPGQIRIKELHQRVVSTWTSVEVADVPGTFSFFTEPQRQGLAETFRSLQSAGAGDLEPGAQFPYLALIRFADGLFFYHFMDMGQRGALYVCYHEAPPLAGLIIPHQLDAALDSSNRAWAVARSSFNDGCWYSKYRADVEIEKKYTFASKVDTWRLNLLIFRAIAAGELEGFIPEFNDEFQVWDFDNYMFEVLSPAEQKGYISFIPQSNGLMSVKQKIFSHDQEERLEKIRANVSVPLDGMRQHAEEMTGGEVFQMAPYRRKRFDVNLESVETGNVYGIFFDICRPHGDTETALYQCEMEYLRSRTLGPLRRVMEEYQRVADFTESFLDAQGMHYEKSFLSKLTFFRAYTQEHSPMAAAR